MRKYTLLFASIILIIVSIWSIYKINQPIIGPIGNNDSIPSNFPLIIISNIFVAIFALIASIQLFRKKK